MVHEEVLAKFADMPEVTRILTSRILRDVNHCPYYRVAEMWFDGPEEWYHCAVENAASFKKTGMG